jgi:NAD(P)-dependent dehydrogenase (short-subunit alcohol dehydrogenase family)
LSLLFLELNGYYVTDVRLHVYDADVLVRRGVDGEGSRYPPICAAAGPSVQVEASVQIRAICMQWLRNDAITAGVSNHRPAANHLQRGKGPEELRERAVEMVLETGRNEKGLGAGPMLCARRALPAMLSARWSRIITVASIWGIIGARGATPYSASKGGLIGFTRALADEVGDDGVFVTAIAPGTVDTPQLAADAAFAGVSLAEIKQRYADDTLVKRIATADEIAGLIAWLAADRTGAFSGETVAVTGGRSE